MALTLRAAITATDTVFDVLGSDDLAAGDYKTLDSETIVIRSVRAATLAYGESARYRVSVYRGAEGSRAAAHDAGATLTAYSAGGGGLPSQWTDGGHGDVTATTDDGSVPLTIAPTDLSALDSFGSTDPLGALVIRNPDTGGSGVGALDIHAVFDRLGIVGSHQVALLGLGEGSGVTHIFLTAGLDDYLMEYSRSDGKIMGFISQTDFVMGVTLPMGLRIKSDDAGTDTVGAQPETFTVSGVRVAVGVNAVFLIRKVSAPDDTDLNPSEVGLWFDDTDGAAKLRIKGKSADGTVVTGSVNLT